MAVEVLDFHYAWAESEERRPPVHLVMIEEPEAHLHAQLQQVFIRKVFDLLPAAAAGFTTQLVVTTHSSHILYESDFRPVRYFCRASDSSGIHCSDVKNLSTFYSEEEPATLEFLQQYLKLTHCDLFFADAAILVEGNVERLLLPLIIARETPDLRACHLTILEVGGAFAHKFQKLVEFLNLTTLVITDLDSIHPGTLPPSEGEDESTSNTACVATTPGAVTSNETLKQWLPKLSEIEMLLSADDEAKTATGSNGAAQVRVAYQTAVTTTWGAESAELAGRTLEEAFALQNLVWCQAAHQKGLGLTIAASAEKDLATLHAALFKRVKGFDKTKFALGLIARPNEAWQAPSYIVGGLEWLLKRLQTQSEVPAPGPSPEVTT